MKCVTLNLRYSSIDSLPNGLTDILLEFTEPDIEDILDDTDVLLVVTLDLLNRADETRGK